MLGSYLIKKNIEEFRKFSYLKTVPDIDPKELGYYLEYDRWFRKLRLKDRLSVFDIGCDQYLSLFHYLLLHGYRYIHYIGNDIGLSANLIYYNGDIINFKENVLLDSFIYGSLHNKFIKIDCEGCEYEYLPLIYKSLSPDISYSIALHFSHEHYEDFQYWYEILLDNGFKLAYRTGNNDFMEYLFIRRRKE